MNLNKEMAVSTAVDNIEVEWTGKFPNLCSGQWIIRVNGEDVSHLLPEDIRHEPMNTYREYHSWYFDEDFCEDWKKYFSGIKYPKWIKKNPWAKEITKDTEELYRLIQGADWRHGSCGGCI